MYIGKHRGQGKEPREDTVPIHIPDNYVGNAFREPPRDEEEPHDCITEVVEEKRTEALPVCLPAPGAEKRESGGFLPRIDKLFSSDALLILLAILLSGNEDGGEISLLLLLLLLF